MSLPLTWLFCLPLHSLIYRFIARGRDVLDSGMLSLQADLLSLFLPLSLDSLIG